MHCFLNIWEFILKRACRRATSPWLFTYWDHQEIFYLFLVHMLFYSTIL